MTRKTRIFAAVTMSVALLLPAAVPAQAAVAQGPASQGFSLPMASPAGASDAFNDWVCRNLGALCGR
ncbi:hypothetical protein ACIGB6_04360 [Paeniglutamicibacter gangotriensis]|uniref:Uncharacterized protein n=1 Tax=Paeniglutamicibacter gangotriensis TaxID=254787 RepID=A0A5B0EGS8_9MICC|nr:hypothetical protein [Paeniglutamicibacter gangotriensis]KAA0977375.1 hypothetical protein FQ154_08770 [Paeniglutamicibacter gangotriensis]